MFLGSAQGHHPGNTGEAQKEQIAHMGIKNCLVEQVGD